MALRLILMVLIFFTPGLGNSQIDFKYVDSVAISIGKAESLPISKLTTVLTSRFDDQILKARAIYAWIANNISYDCPAFHSESKRKSKPEDVLKFRKAVCEGYANLFLEMSSYAGIQCVTIDGYSRVNYEEIGQKLSHPNHSWNAIRINNEWRLVDVTWASGFTDKKVKHFTKDYSSAYFLTDPVKFLASHYPVVNSWKPAKSTLSKKKFSESPLVKEGYYVNDIASFAPKKGIIKARLHTIISLSFEVSNPSDIYSLVLLIGEDKMQIVQRPGFSVSNNTILYHLACEKTGIYPLTIFLNDVATLQYQLIIE